MVRKLARAYIKWRLSGVFHFEPPLSPVWRLDYISINSVAYKCHRFLYLVKKWQYTFETRLDMWCGYEKERTTEVILAERKRLFRQLVELIETEKEVECGQLSKKEALQRLLDTA